MKFDRWKRKRLHFPCRRLSLLLECLPRVSRLGFTKEVAIKRKMRLFSKATINLLILEHLCSYWNDEQIFLGRCAVCEKRSYKSKPEEDHNEQGWKMCFLLCKNRNVIVLSSLALPSNPSPMHSGIFMMKKLKWTRWNLLHLKLEWLWAYRFNQNKPSEV